MTVSERGLLSNLAVVGTGGEETGTNEGKLEVHTHEGSGASLILF